MGEAVYSPKADLIAGKIPAEQLPVITAAMVAEDVATQGELDSVAAALPVLQTKRITTGSIATITNAIVAVTWDVPFANANYTIVASVMIDEAGDSLRVLRSRSKTAEGCVVLVRNDALVSKTGELHVIAISD